LPPSLTAAGGWSLLEVLSRRHREVPVRGNERSRQLEHEALRRLRELEAGHEHAA